ncbi:MAG: phosphoadenylyl-sulfate reductase [Roseovarius sp.]|nr:phosphoadenylyl-sulfate reductase [Roseovarius sp.]
MPPSDPAAHVAALNARLRHHSATAVLAHALGDPVLGRIALVSSFGAESAVLLHMLSLIRRETAVILVDTQLLFAETLVYQQELAERLGLRDMRIVRAAEAELAHRDPDGGLHRRDPDACCALRKTAPLKAALAEFGGWITGRKRFHGATRQELEFFEAEPGTGRVKVNPLAHWRRQDVQAYIEENRLPRHPLVARGYPSIGCMPCTSKVDAGEDIRAGRWRGRAKTECGIHFADGRATRQGMDA